MKHLFLVLILFMISCSEDQSAEKYIVETMKSPAGSNSEEPTFFKTPEGIGLTWLEKSGDQVSFNFAVYKNSSWNKPKSIVSGDEVLANWADFPGMQTNGSHWIAWYLQMNNPDSFAYDVMVMQSSNNGESWTTPQKLHSDSTLTEHGFVSAVATEAGFQLIWLDGRLATEESPIFSLRSAHIDFNGVITNRTILDDNTCSCCQTSMLNIGADNHIAFYRNRTEEEIRDIAGVSFANNGEIINQQILFADKWHISGCPVNGPRSIMRGDEIGVAWFTMAKDEVAKVQFVTSTNSGKTFSEPLLIDTGNIGRVDVIANEEAFYISYIDENEVDSSIKIAKVVEGNVNAIFTIARVSPSRKTGFPRMILDKNEMGIYIAYTNIEMNQIQLKYLNF